MRTHPPPAARRRLVHPRDLEVKGDSGDQRVVSDEAIKEVRRDPGAQSGG